MVLLMVLITLDHTQMNILLHTTIRTCVLQRTCRDGSRDFSWPLMTEWCDRVQKVKVGLLANTLGILGRA